MTDTTPNTITKPNGKTRPLRNLRPILTHATKHGVRTVVINEKPGGRAELCVCFHDDTRARIDFASFRFCVDFVHSRRTWRDAQLIINNI